MDGLGSIIMKCLIENRENAELLLAYCARKLDPETQTILERHLAACPECREFQKNQETVWQALDAWEAMPVSMDFDRRLYRRIEEEESRASWWSRLMRPFRPMFAPALMTRSVPLAAAACLLMIAGVILERPHDMAAPEDLADARMESIQPDQVESTLDDMEMLRQLKPSPGGEAGTVNAM
jgi:anti-sigma factor RsiW